MNLRKQNSLVIILIISSRGNLSLSFLLLLQSQPLKDPDSQVDDCGASEEDRGQGERSRLQGRQVKNKIVDNLFSTHTHIHKTHTKDKKTKRSDHSVKLVEGNSSNRRTKKSGGASNKCQRLQREYVRSIKSLSDTGAKTRSG